MQVVALARRVPLQQRAAQQPVQKLLPVPLNLHHCQRRVAVEARHEHTELAERSLGSRLQRLVAQAQRRLHAGLRVIGAVRVAQVLEALGFELLQVAFHAPRAVRQHPGAHPQRERQVAAELRQPPSVLPDALAHFSQELLRIGRVQGI